MLNPFYLILRNTSIDRAFYANLCAICTTFAANEFTVTEIYWCIFMVGLQSPTKLIDLAA
jgi:hypothetical protein